MSVNIFPMFQMKIVRRQFTKKKMRSPGIEPGSITWQATIITTRPRALNYSKKAPEVRLELTTYRLTAGRATDCAIQELLSLSVSLLTVTVMLLSSKIGKKKKKGAQKVESNHWDVNPPWI